jgi:hypothetical protein
VFHTQDQLVLAVFTKLPPDRKDIPEIELGAETLVVGSIQGSDVVGADAQFCKPAPEARRGI